MADYIEQGEVKQVIVQRKDGSTWTAEIGLDGKVRLLNKLHDPSVSADVEDEDEDEQQVEQPQQPDQAEADGDEGEGEQSDESGDPDEGWGEAEPADDQYDDQEIKSLIENMAHRGSSAPAEAGKAPKRKLNDEYHKRLKDPAFLARLTSVMLDNKYARRVRGRTRGKLDMARLYKVPTHSRSVFVQKQERKGKNYNVVLVVDQSGSMGGAGGRPAEVAAETVLFLAKQFENLNLNIGVIGYGSYVKVHKELNTKKFNYDELYSNLTNSYGGTNDYPALRRAYHMFHGAPEGQNILIHISDGGPGRYFDSAFRGVDNKVEKLRHLAPLAPGAGEWGSNDVNYIDYNQKEHLHHLVKSHPEVVAVGIGIQHGGWQIPEHFIIQNVSELKSTILGILRRNIKRG